MAIGLIMFCLVWRSFAFEKWTAKETNYIMWFPILGNSLNGRTRATSCNSQCTTGSGIQSSLNRDPHQLEVRFLRTPRESQIREERIVFVSGKKAPIAIFSALPYNRRSFYGPLRYGFARSLLSHFATLKRDGYCRCLYHNDLCTARNAPLAPLNAYICYNLISYDKRKVTAIVKF